MSNGKWIGAAAGWFFGGPIGGIIGYYVGKNLFASKVDNKTAFEISLLILSSVVIKADGKVLKSELDYVKKFFTNTFGTKKSNDYFRMFNNLNKQDYSSKLRQVCLQLNSHINHSSRLEIIHFLFGVAASDNDIHPKEVETIMDYYKSQMQKYLLKRSLYAKGLMTLTLHRMNDDATAGKILKSLKEFMEN